MALNLALIIVLGLILSRFFSRAGLPGLLGMLLLGVAICPYGFNWIDPTFLGLSRDLRIITLIIILLRAGLGLHRDAIRKVGMPAVKMSFIPCLLEGLAITFLANQILGISYLEAGMLGFIIAAVSPSVIVPQMLSFIERGMGTTRGVPTLILAGASADDVVAITVFSVFLGTYLGKSVNLVWTVLGIPLSIILGIISGLILGYTLLHLFKRFKIRNSEKLLLILAAAIFIKGIGDALHNWVPVAGLIGVIGIGFVIVDRNPNLGVQLSEKFTKVWILAEIILFVLVGAQVNIYLAISAGAAGILIISGGLLARSLGVYLSLLGTRLTSAEKIFSMVAYNPKAKVQAAMGAVPLEVGVASGDIILAVSVLAILFTAPLGAVGVKIVGEKVLKEEKN
ncbi:MAG: cation:proton antiporter [Methanobacteriaceae archaeon]|nr:cation:proton antiporter [Methanobacteriaceae archaeon]